MMAEMAWNSGEKCTVSQSTSAPAGAPTSISGIAVLPVVPVGGGERGQQGGPRDDTEQLSVGVGDGQGDAVAPDERADLAQRRLRVDRLVLGGRELPQLGALLPDGRGQQVRAGDALD